MKKQNLKSLKLNKNSISNLDILSVQGGAVSGNNLCPKDTKRDGDCWIPTIMNSFPCQATATICGGADCVKSGN